MLTATLYFWLVFVHFPDGRLVADPYTHPQLCATGHEAWLTYAQAHPGVQVSPCEVIKVVGSEWSPN